MRVRNKRILKNGSMAGYVLQKDGTWRFRFLKGIKKQKGGFNWNLSEDEKKKINESLTEVSKIKGIELINEKKREELENKLSFIKKINIYSIINYIASNENLRKLLKKILNKGITPFNTRVGNEIKNGLINELDKMNNKGPTQLFFIAQGFNIDTKNKESGKKIIESIIDVKKKYTSQENTELFQKIQQRFQQRFQQPFQQQEQQQQPTNNGIQPINENQRRNNSNLKKKQNELKNTIKKIQKIVGINISSRNNKFGLFNNNENKNEKNLIDTAKQFMKNKIKEKNSLQELYANQPENRNNERLKKINNNVREINNLIKKEEKLQKNIKNLLNKNEALGMASNMFSKAEINYEKKRSDKLKKNKEETLKKIKNHSTYIENKIKELINLLKKKANSGFLNSVFGTKGYRYYKKKIEKEFEKIKNKQMKYSNLNEFYNNLLTVMKELRTRTKKGYDKKATDDRTKIFKLVCEIINSLKIFLGNKSNNKNCKEFKNNRKFKNLVNRRFT